MRRLALVLLGLVLLVAPPLAVSGFWADHALSDHAGYAERMQQQWLQGDVRAEFGAVVTDRAREQIQGSLGEGGLADIATGFATSFIASGLGSEAFVGAWGDWHRQLHEDLAAIVKGQSPRTVSVDGTFLTVDIAPLVSSLLTGPIGGLALRVVGQEGLVQRIDTGYDLAGQLESFGRLWSIRWGVALGSVIGLALWTALWRPRLRGAGLGLLLAAAGCAVAGLWRVLAAPPPGGDFPALTGAINDALLAGWSTWLLVGGALFGAAGAALLVLGRAPRNAAAPSAAQ